MNTADFYAPLDYGWSEEQYEVDLALQQFCTGIIPDCSDEVKELAQRVAEQEQATDIESWAKKLAKDFSKFTD